MVHESRMHASNLFVTLTLDRDHLNEKRELCPKDLSGFIKNLRRAEDESAAKAAREPRRISWFGCGEYGSANNRPHYHSLLFGIDFLDKYRGDDGSGRDFWKSDALDAIWARGRTEIGTVNMASASYVAGYLRKKVKNRDYARANPLTGELLSQEFARMSLRPAIGRRWIKRWWRDVYPRDFVVIDGYEAKPPRFYDKFMDLEDIKGGSQERREIMDAVRSKRMDEAPHLSDYSRAAGEAAAKSRINLFARRDRV